MRHFISINEASDRYGPKEATWRRWVLEGSLGDAVLHFGRLVRLDVKKLDERLAQTGQLLVPRRTK